MEKIIMLGTGHGMTLDLYNTCFVLQNEEENFLIDTGGGAELINRLLHKNIGLDSIRHIFISHSHIDHIMGFLWLMKKQGLKLDYYIHLYCNDLVYENIIMLIGLVLNQKFLDIFKKYVVVHILKDNDSYTIGGNTYTFFDILGKGVKQFGFEWMVDNKKYMFLGDESLSKELYSRVLNAYFVMHEAFCLDSEESIFKAYQKNHSTVKSACDVLDSLHVKNVLLYHTEDTHKNRKELYLEEAKKSFKGHVFIPDDLEEIEINSI